ncbi:MAG: hypothetical protein M1819_004575 [Sarea resinae]|nr:MAG: hypothetical protein M1819_004575 [Sarea resinae]
MIGSAAKTNSKGQHNARTPEIGTKQLRSLSNFIEHSRKDARNPVTLDFDARVPIPFSVFPSSYRSDAVTTEATQVQVEEAEIDLPSRASRVGREGHAQETSYSSFEASLPPRKDRDRSRYEQESVNVYEEERPRPRRREDFRRPDSRREDFTVYEESDRYRHQERYPEVQFAKERYQEPYRRYSESHIEVDLPRRRHDREYPIVHGPATHYAGSDIGSETAVPEREYRQRTQASYAAEEPPRRESQSRKQFKVEKTKTTVDGKTDRKIKMGYFDDDGHYHSFRHGLHRAADRIFRPHTERDDIYVDDAPKPARGGAVPNTITIPCHHIRIGDILILQGRPCQIIRITTSAQTGQHRYLGVDLFSKQLHEESSFISNPAPSVIVQNMSGPVFKQYRVLDCRDDGRVVAMTETGDVKQGLPVIDQGGLWTRLNESFANGRGSVRVLVINDGGRELAVDYKVVHGSRL